ncbi:hypothetical protein RKE29_12620 [Streptomyces sp. B1866]|uniref:hypothetical protein n=1 Tax=Streptomyces sp. B1866 TaxID=3075431 RepID=UPI00288D388D|nr:hypothetical protein [Streptomyces sp. B1866]MDT3397483.1 hypothetical protein [Streptomyces sp. B1866]
MNKTWVAAGSAAAALVLTVGGWLGYQAWNSSPGAAGESLAAYDGNDVNQVARYADQVFEATVLSRGITKADDDFTSDSYGVRVTTPLKGTPGKQPTLWLEHGTASLTTGKKYIFATTPLDDGGLWQLTETVPDDATATTLRAWRDAVH